MTTVATEYVSGEQVDSFYVVAEPNYKDTINVYLKSN